jgi:DNA-binding response OmpR family regulator
MKMARVLVIDDEAALRQFVKRVLVRAGHEVIEAADGAAGLARFAAERPAIVITDILVPAIDGIDAIKAVRRIDQTAWIIAMSGGGARHNMHFLDFAKASGADAALEKPFSHADLIAAVEARRSSAGFALRDSGASP